MARSEARRGPNGSAADHQAAVSASDDEAARLSDVHAALDAIVASPVDLTDGRTWVDELRQGDQARQEDIEAHRR